MQERFIKPVSEVIAISLFAWILFWVIFSISKEKKGIKISLKAEITYFLFYSYVIGVMSLTVFPLPFNRFNEPNGNGINIIPFISIGQGLLEMLSSKKIFTGNFQNIVGNIILFVPLGMFVPLLSGKYRSIGKIAILACICSVSIELTQLVSRQFEIYRTADINDVILNTSGAILGFVIINKWYLNKDKSKRRVK